MTWSRETDIDWAWSEKASLESSLSLASVSQSGSGKKNSQQEGLTQNEHGVPEMLGEYGRNLLTINTLAGKAAPPRPGQDTGLSLCDGNLGSIQWAEVRLIHGLTKNKIVLGHWVEIAFSKQARRWGIGTWYSQRNRWWLGLFSLSKSTKQIRKMS